MEFFDYYIPVFYPSKGSVKKCYIHNKIKEEEYNILSSYESYGK
jgi:hypothetical protein